ncbi:MAG: anti-sigma factor [Gloeomargarita sp. GMQP_bins_120]
MTSMADPHPEHLTDLVLEECDPVELLAWEGRLQQDPALAQEVAELQAVWHSLAYGCEPVTPPPSLRGRILATAPGRPRRWLWAAATAGLVGIMGLGMANWQLWRQWRLAQQELRLQQVVMAALRHQDTRMAILIGATPMLRGATVRVLTLQRQVLVVFNDKLPPPPQNHVYVLWAITKDNRHFPCGQFVPNKNGIIHWTNPRFLPHDPRVKALVITSEPDMGNVPRGFPMMSSGSL